MAANNFKAFGIGNNANVTSQTDYEALPALATGFSSGKASSAQINKALRQSTFVTSAISQFISNTINQDVLDDGDLNGFITKLISSLNTNGDGRYLQKANYLKEILDAGNTAQNTARGNLGLGTSATQSVQTSFTDKAGKIALNGGWGVGITADQAAGTMAGLDVSRFDYFNPSDNLGPYPGQWAGGISFANSGVTGWQLVGASLGSVPSFSARIKTGSTTFSNWFTLYHSGNKPTPAVLGALAAASNLSDVANTTTARTNLGLGTAATKAVGTGTSQIPDMNSFQSGANGYGTWIRHPSGVMIQFGYLPSSGPSANITFPTPFTTNPSYTLSPTATAGVMAIASGATTTKISDVRAFDTQGNILTNAIQWIAIGS